ncbi:MAG: hypothetical protein F6K16_21970 [Symploca sp. SIO2B6]|nr:hypothetical protein [Symploca sp. SIO2B6]
MVHGSWFIVHGSWLMVHSSWLMAHGSWLMVHGSWLIGKIIRAVVVYIPNEQSTMNNERFLNNEQ